MRFTNREQGSPLHVEEEVFAFPGADDAIEGFEFLSFHGAIGFYNFRSQDFLQVIVVVEKPQGLLEIARDRDGFLESVFRVRLGR